ncbi:MAG: hypothetical protein Q9171_007336 [Xanthocarpia ochracea]
MEEGGMVTKEEALEKVIAIRQDAFEKVNAQLDGMVEEAEKNILGSKITSQDHDHLTEVLPGFPERVEGEIVFCDADNINTDGIYSGRYTYQVDVSTEKVAKVRMSNYDKAFASTAQEGNILVTGFNFGCGSLRERAVTAILAKKIPLVVAGSFGNIFSRNSIDNTLMGVEVPKLVQRLRETFSRVKTEGSQQDVTEPLQNSQSLDSPPPASPAAPPQEKLLTRTRWRLVWDVRRSKVDILEGKNGQRWSQKVGKLPSNVQEIIATGRLEKWVKN